ncbi:helix-turn-helix domain-containing protein [Thiolapillus brandeum]|uniref:CRP/FNR family transcriptional regulator anaerobic regulatory protein n=1 Tax=Thiolapillus brandeum TaxID=1076588 RepID=A0A7U6GJ64_9GAMM|nr:helix-turn-helix domain-containing protein [Thiolapillus brandeum]BAO44579.1 CRP/FNR family transcriptional regulator anaerobic regulatory protein [Thiolapillus brandeum]
MELKVAAAVACRDCALYQTAKVLGLETPDCSSLNRVVLRDHPVNKNEVLYREGDSFRYLYLVHSGSCISSATILGRRSQVMGFYLPGEMAGIESIGQQKCNHTTRVLEKGSVCQLDFLMLEETLGKDELIRVQSYLLGASAIHARQLQWERSLTSLQTAEQRVAAFLLNLAGRFESHGFPGHQFRLPMSREAIADYLGLAMETVIRTLKSLHKKGLISSRAKHIEILDRTALSTLLRS